MVEKRTYSLSVPKLDVSNELCVSSHMQTYLCPLLHSPAARLGKSKEEQLLIERFVESLSIK